eukprot:SAG11_NODE_17281_length_523_cov_0.849057_1_plen_174_part_11
MTFQECFHAAATTLAAPGRLFRNTTGSDPSRPAGCSATTQHELEVAVYFNHLANSTVGCGQHAKLVAGATDSLVFVSVSLDATKNAATITLTGPADVWFGAGFGSANMVGTYAVIVEAGGAGSVSERKLGQHLAGTELKASLKVMRSSVTNGRRTVVLSRPLKGDTADYYSFSI